MRKSIFIQARLSSSRFPGKMLESLGGIPLIHYIFNRCDTSKYADDVVVITSNQPSDDPLFEYCNNNKIPVFRGPLNNVLDRYIQAAIHFNSNMICRVCGDSPFVDIEYIDKMFHEMKDGDDYLSVSGSYNGFISEMIKLKALLKAQRLTNSSEDLEHVTPFIRNNSHLFGSRNLNMQINVNKIERVSLTIDYEHDLDLANYIIKKGVTDFEFTAEKIVSVLHKHYPEYEKSKEDNVNKRTNVSQTN